MRNITSCFLLEPFGIKGVFVGENIGTVSLMELSDDADERERREEKEIYHYDHKSMDSKY